VERYLPTRPRRPLTPVLVPLVTLLSPHAPCPTPHAPRSSGSAVDAARRAGYPWPELMGRKKSRKVRETRSSNSRHGPSERRKGWQRIELGIYGPGSKGRNWSRKSPRNAESKQTKRPERGRKCWQRFELGIHGRKSWGPNLSVWKSPSDAELRRPSRSRFIALETVAASRFCGIFMPPIKRISAQCQPSISGNRLR
jgi:hypothetical protein